MKNRIFLFVVFFTATFCAHSQNYSKITTSDEMSTYAFNILKNLEETSEKDFINSFISIEEIKAYIAKEKATDGGDIKETINEFTKKEYEEKVAEALTELKEAAKEYKIVWSDIEFSEYSFKEETQAGFTGIRGDVIFKYKNQKYKAIASAFLIDNKYAPLIVRRLRKIED